MASSSRISGRFWAAVRGGAIVLLVVVGLAAAAGRGFFLRDAAAQGDALRLDFLHAVGRSDPFQVRRAQEVREFDQRYATRPVITFLHIVSGAIFLIATPFQFLPGIRARHIRLHRWSGRLLVGAGFTAVLTGMYFGMVIPIAGHAEAVPIAIVGGLFVVALSMAVGAIRRQDIARHREWMIRAFWVALGVGLVRIVTAIIDLSLSSAEFDMRHTLVVSFWIGWATSFAVAEFWIRHTRSAS